MLKFAFTQTTNKKSIDKYLTGSIIVIVVTPVNFKKGFFNVSYAFLLAYTYIEMNCSTRFDYSICGMWGEGFDKIHHGGLHGVMATHQLACAKTKTTINESFIDY